VAVDSLPNGGTTFFRRWKLPCMGRTGVNGYDNFRNEIGAESVLWYLYPILKDPADMDIRFRSGTPTMV
jgi:hypothetical protein